MIIPKKFTYTILYLMLLSPLLSYVTVTILGTYTSTIFFKILIIVYFPLFLVLNKNIKIDKLLYFLMLYIIYIGIWSFFNGELERIGLMKVIYRHIQIATLFIIIIIYNTRFSDKFIRNAIFIFKVTVILAVLVSIIQVADQSFLSPFDYRDQTEANYLDIYQFRRNSIFGFVDTNEMGLSFIPLLAVFIGFLLDKKNKIFLPYLLMGGIVAILSNTRYVMVGFILILLQFYVTRGVKLTKIFKYSTLIFIIGFVLYQSLMYLGYNLQDWVSERLFAEGDITKTTRYGAIVNFAVFFPQAPFFGVGVHLTNAMKMASEAVGSSQIHVGYLAHILSWGLMGSFFLFGFWFLLAKKLFKTAKQTKYWGSFLAFLIYFWAQATLVNYSIFFYGLVFALVFDKYYQDKYKLRMISQVTKDKKV